MSRPRSRLIAKADHEFRTVEGFTTARSVADCSDRDEGAASGYIAARRCEALCRGSWATNGRAGLGARYTGPRRGKRSKGCRIEVRRWRQPLGNYATDDTSAIFVQRSERNPQWTR